MILCANIYCATYANITQHHLFPKGYRRGLKGKIPRVYLCRKCHDQVHILKHNAELAMAYNTKQKIIELLSSDIKFRLQRFRLVAA